VRLRGLFVEWGLLDDLRIEEFIEKVDIYCFKAEIPPGNFVEFIHKVTSMANQFETSVDSLPSEIQGKQEKLKSLHRRVKMIGKSMEHLHAKYKVTTRDIADYKTNKPLLVDENTRLKTENEILKQENSALRKENSQQYSKLYEYSYNEMISEHELRKLDHIWLPNEGKMLVTELHEIAHEIYRNPVRYINIIRLIRKNRIQKAAA
jgi:regulator of replication initiation timing